ncbi:MAG: exopolysaccharide biosynthesis protein [Verrucomicrobia bacterium]|nr:exopolysaccharide biosynthesis protein [Verrucomicrobiota bacterium]
MKHEKERSLKADLDILLERASKNPTLLIGEILGILSGKGRSLILIFLSLPFCLPIQIPGLSTPFGISIALIGLRLAFGKRVWLPNRILAKTISSKTIQKITQKSLNLISKMKRFMHSRLEFVCDHGAMKVFNGLLIFLLGILLALPLPIPLTNLSAGWSILLLSLGLLESDGVFVFIGYLFSTLTLLFFTLTIFSIKLAL